MQLVGEKVKILKPPMELLGEAIADPDRFARDRANVLGSGSVERYFRNTEAIEKSFDKKRKNPFDEATLRFAADFQPEDGVNYYMHIDLSTLRRKRGDACGLSMGHASGYKEIYSKERSLEMNLPIVTVDFLGRVLPVPGKDISPTDIMGVVIFLRERGFYLRLVTFDGIGLSAIPRMELKERWDIETDYMSIDRTATIINLRHRPNQRVSTDKQYLIAYETAKAAWNQGRVNMPEHPHLMKEVKESEFWPRHNKIQAVRGGSDDLLQSVLGTILNVTVNESGQDFQLSMSNSAPQGWPADPYYAGRAGWKPEMVSLDQARDERYSR